MVDFTQPDRVRGFLAPDDQLASMVGKAGQARLNGISAAVYYDPPDFPIPMARAPVGNFGITLFERGPNPMRIGQPTGAPNGLTQWGLGGAGITYQSEYNRRRTVHVPVDYGVTQREDDIPGGLALGPGNEWFEQMLAVPVELALGNILSTQIRTVELMNLFRRPFVDIDWTTFVNNTNGGITIQNLPGLPFVIDRFDSFIANVQISTAGPPSISGSLDFTFGAPFSGTLSVDVTGNRITIFQYRPQTPISETLEFLTDVLPNHDGSEQRIRVREAPRQVIDMRVLVDDELARDSLNATLYDWQARVFGVPIWWEARPLEQDIAVNDTTINVDTADADYRVGGLVMIYTSDQSFEVLEVSVINPTNIETATEFQNAFSAVNTQIMPMRTAFTRPNLNNRRFAIGPSDFAITFTTLDNVDLADIGAFDTYMGVGQTVAKPLLTEFNFMPGPTIQEGNRRRVVRMDVESGPPTQFSPWSKGKPTYQFGFEAKSFNDTWRWRQLMHYLHGSQLSFYVPTGRTDFKILSDPIGNGATVFDCENFGFTLFVNQVTPRSDIRFFRTDGTFSLHQVVSSVEISSTVERITITPGLPSELPLSELQRCEFVTLSRISDDKVTLQHRRPGESRLDFTLLGVPA